MLLRAQQSGHSTGQTCSDLLYSAHARPEQSDNSRCKDTSTNRLGCFGNFTPPVSTAQAKNQRVALLMARSVQTARTPPAQRPQEEMTLWLQQGYKR